MICAMNGHQVLPSVETISRPLPTLPDSNRRILLVEDDAELRRFNTEVLTRNGYYVDAVEDGALAWDVLTARSYDLLITDNSMPKVTGIELLKKLQNANMAVAVIMATGVLPEWEFRRNPALAPAVTLVKPYTVPELLRAVRTVLDSADKLDETMSRLQYGQGQSLPNHLSL